MQIVRTIFWILLLIVFVAFSVANWEPLLTVHIWQNLVVETRMPAIVLISFLIGFLPMWLLHRGKVFYLNRRIGSLETAARTAAVTPVAPPVVADPAADPVVAPEHPVENPGPLKSE